MPQESLYSLLEQTLKTLDTESCEYRPANTFTGLPGGLLDFCSEQKRLPTLVVPDLHARLDFFNKVMEYKLQVLDSDFDGSATIFELLKSGNIRIVCLGDGLHSELHKERWLAAYNEFEKGIITGNNMHQEMQDGLLLMEQIFSCKCKFPEFFHFLKGNHENILNSNRGGNHSFRKFVQEGEMVRLFMMEYYGQELLHLYASVEEALPLCAICPNCILSHAEPERAYSREELIDGLFDSQVIHGLTWTNNGDSQEGSVKRMLDLLQPNFPEALYLGGHRPVSGKYALRQQNKFVQIHNPRMQNVAIVLHNRAFNPETDIISLDEKKRTSYNDIHGGENG
ncbi:MAG: hypothetical protein J6B81_02965 [Spirochaetaceae bacterium]|nr:hypothetical protein [Spirochaetaceae bacterium]